MTIEGENQETNSQTAGGGTDGGGDKSGGNQSMLNVDKLKGKTGGENEGGTKTTTQEEAAAAALAAKDKNIVDKPGQQQKRPDWLKNDKFWDAEKGQVNTELMNRNLTELETKFSKGQHKAPEKPEGYKMQVSEDVAKTLFGGDVSKAAEDPAIKKLNNFMHKYSMPQEAYDEFMGLYAEHIGPAQQALVIDVKAEKAKLGKNADAVIENQFQFLETLYKAKAIGDAEVDEARILMETAAGVKFLQAIREHYGENPIPVDNLNQDKGMPTKDELAAMLNDPKYESDPAYKKKVDNLYEKMYGNGPAMSSLQAHAMTR
jgi:hypothetical protein